MGRTVLQFRLWLPAIVSNSITLNIIAIKILVTACMYTKRGLPERYIETFAMIEWNCHSEKERRTD